MEYFDCKFDQYEDNFAKYHNVKSIPLYDTRKIKDVFISFIIPTYKRTKYLLDAIDSILSAKITTSYEIIVIDNSGDISNNEIVNLLREKHYQSLAFYVNENNIGMAGNWNRGFELATGKWVSMLHDDDLLSDAYGQEIMKCLNTAIRVSRKKEVGVIKVSSIEFSDDNVPYGNTIRGKGEITELTLPGTLVKFFGPSNSPTCGMMFNKEAVFAVGGFNERYYPSLDSIIGFQIQKKGFTTFRTVDRLGYYRKAVNATGKKETIIKWSYVDCYFQYYCLNYNKALKALSLLCGKAAYTMLVDILMERAKKYCMEPVALKEIIHFPGYGVRGYKLLLFKAIKKIVMIPERRIYTYK